MSDVVCSLSKMFKKARAFFALTAFVITAINCEISIYKIKDSRQVNIKFQDSPSLFGGDISIEGIEVVLTSDYTCRLKLISQFIIFKGNIVSAFPEDACSKIDPPESNSKNDKWFALILRGNCNFDVKVRNAQNSNFSLAIVYDISSNNVCKYIN